MVGALAQGNCQKCRRPRIMVNGETKCLICEPSASGPVGPTSTVQDPGEEKMRGMLAGKGVVVPPSKVEQKPSPGVAALVDVQDKLTVYNKPSTINDKEACVKGAISWLRAMPMPEDVKQFRNIQKIVKSLEDLLEK